MTNTILLETPKNGVAQEQKFITANSQSSSLQSIRNQHIIPVFVKDNQPTTSQADFIQTTVDLSEDFFGIRAKNLSVRVSHPIKGRIFEARNKKAADLLEHEKTIYFERMAFIIEMPIKKKLFGQELSLTIAGVKAYNQDNLYSNSSNSLQSFKVAIGFKVKVCTNLCIFTDGANLSLKAHSIEDLQTQIRQLFALYSDTAQLEALQTFGDYKLSEIQFATILGKTRLYNFLPRDTKKDIPEFIISDTQVNVAAKQYYKDEYFGRSKDGSINLWNFYNLLTDGVKNSYIDTFLDRNLNAFEFTQGIAKALEGESEYSWFLN